MCFVLVTQLRLFCVCVFWINRKGVGLKVQERSWMWGCALAVSVCRQSALLNQVPLQWTAQRGYAELLETLRWRWDSEINYLCFVVRWESTTLTPKVSLKWNIEEWQRKTETEAIILILSMCYEFCRWKPMSCGLALLIVSERVNHLGIWQLY